MVVGGAIQQGGLHPGYSLQGSGFIEGTAGGVSANYTRGGSGSQGGVDIDASGRVGSGARAYVISGLQSENTVAIPPIGCDPD